MNTKITTLDQMQSAAEEVKRHIDDVASATAKNIAKMEESFAKKTYVDSKIVDALGSIENMLAEI